MLPRLMDQNQLQLAQALKEGSEQSGTWHSLRASLRDAFLACKGGIAFWEMKLRESMTGGSNSRERNLHS